MTAALISATAAVVVALIEAIAARDHSGGLLLFRYVPRVHENQTVYHSVRNIYQVVPHLKKRNRNNSFKFA